MQFVKAGVIACRRVPKEDLRCVLTSPSSGHILGETVKNCEVAWRIVPKKDLQ